MADRATPPTTEGYVPSALVTDDLAGAEVRPPAPRDPTGPGEREGSFRIAKRQRPGELAPFGEAGVSAYNHNPPPPRRPMRLVPTSMKVRTRPMSLSGNYSGSELSSTKDRH